MRGFNNVQKVIFVLGVLGTILGIYGKLGTWDSKNSFILIYMGLSFMWIASLSKTNECEKRFFKRMFKKITK